MAPSLAPGLVRKRFESTAAREHDSRLRRGEEVIRHKQQDDARTWPPQRQSYFVFIKTGPLPSFDHARGSNVGARSASLPVPALLPAMVRAQQPAKPVIGYLGGNSPQAGAEELGQFREGLSETGHVEGQNVAIEYRWAQGRTDILASLTADLIRLRVSMLAGLSSTAAVRAAMAATSATPVLFAIGGDPVKNGLVASLNQPGGKTKYPLAQNL
jgi:ABC transporter substrate binding protein